MGPGKRVSYSPHRQRDKNTADCSAFMQKNPAPLQPADRVGRSLEPPNSGISFYPNAEAITGGGTEGLVLGRSDGPGSAST